MRRETLVAVFAGVFVVIALLLRKFNYRFFLREREWCVVVVVVIVGSWSCALVVFVSCSCVVGCVVVVMVMGVVGRASCLSLLLTKSLSRESHFEPSCAAVSQVASLARSLLSLFVLVRWEGGRGGGR